MLKISVVTPSYNQVAFLNAAINSVLQQEYPSLEYLVIDGGSDDGSLEIIRKHADRLAYWVSEPDEGHGDALNKGFRLATGDILAWLNSDDMYTPWAFAVVAEIFEQHPDIDWLVGVNALWDPHGRQVEVCQVYKNVYDFLLGDYQWIQQESVFFRKRLYEQAGGMIDTSYKLMVDGNLWCRFFEYAELHHAPVVLAGYRMHRSNRARLYWSEVNAEMHQAIESMRTRLPAQTLEGARQLQLLRSRLRMFDRRWMPRAALGLVRRQHRQALEAASYPTLKYEHDSGRWVTRSVPWSTGSTGL